MSTDYIKILGHNWAEVEDRFASAIAAGIPVLLHGPPGTGKSHLGRTFKTERVDPADDAKVADITLTDEGPVAELRGHYHPKGHEFQWVDGPATDMSRKGGRLIIQELDHASPDVMDMLHVLLEPDGKFILPTKETIRRGELEVVATTNADPSVFRSAIQDRVLTIEVKSPSPEVLGHFPEEWHRAIAATVLDSHQRVSIRRWDYVKRLVEGGMTVANALRWVTNNNDTATAMLVDEAVTA